MPFWMLVLILVTLITLCWGGGYGFWRSMPDRPFVGGLLGILGLILFIVLVMIFINGGAPLRHEPFVGGLRGVYGLILSIG